MSKIVDNQALLKILDGVAEVVAFALAGITAVRAKKKYEERRTKQTLHLLIFMAIVGILPLFQLSDSIFYPSFYPVKYGYAFIILLSALGNVYLLFFSVEVFLKEGENLALSWRIYRVVAIVGELAFSVVGFLLKLRDLDVTIYLAAHFLIALQLYVVLATRSFALSRRVEGEYRRPLQYIGGFSGSLLAVYSFFILDSFYTNYTVWGFLGWAVYAFMTLLGYMGFARGKKRTNVKKKKR
ncbi:MAG: hypothetical protein Kow0069_35630 [Promethearchaeota archaeon]